MGFLAEATGLSVNSCPPHVVPSRLFLGTGTGSHLGAGRQLAASGEIQGEMETLIPTLPCLLS